MKYQIYVDRGNGLELDGCWGSEHAKFQSIKDARQAARHLSKAYPDCAWVVCNNDNRQISRIEARELLGEL